MKRMITAFFLATLWVAGGCTDNTEPIPPTPPPPPVEQTIVLTAPANNASYDLYAVENVAFDWTPVEGVTDYTLSLLSSDLTQSYEMPATAHPFLVTSGTLDAVLSSFGVGIGAEATVSWQIKPAEAVDNVTTQVRTLRLKRRNGIVLTAPADSAAINLTGLGSLSFTWEEATGISDYKLVIGFKDDLSDKRTYPANAPPTQHNLSDLLLETLLAQANVGKGESVALYWSVVPSEASASVTTYVRVAYLTRATATYLKVASIYSNNMVLQREATPAVWGTETPGGQVTVTGSWDNQPRTAVADAKGNWRTTLTTPAAGGPYTLRFEGSRTYTYTNVMTGDVWLASGQSNMAKQLRGWPDEPVEGDEAAIASAGGKNIHFITVPYRGMYKAMDDFSSSQSWKAASASNAGECTAVGWFFADALRTELGNGVPIGIINASVGATSIESWMSREACARQSITLPAEREESVSNIYDIPTIYYNGMIHPLVGFSIKGMIWYQGEANIGSRSSYTAWQKEMVADWRTRWGCGEFPFYFVQIAPFNYGAWSAPNLSPYMREVQLHSKTEVPNSGIAVTLDVGEEAQIHPRRKKEVGERLAGMALYATYSRSVAEPYSPEYRSMAVSGSSVTLTFDKDLRASPTPAAALFEVAGANRTFYAATQVSVVGKTVVVSSSSVATPVAVRYAFKDFAVGELFGAGGLPVSSFRTDTW
jgi:sialate O-acetylesterase